MNLYAMREYIKRSSDYSPGNTDYRDWVNDVINQAYFQTYTERYWTFDQKKHQVRALAVFDSAAAIRDMTARNHPSIPDTVGIYTRPGWRVVHCPYPLYRLHENPWDWIGQYLYIEGVSRRIVWIESNGSLTTTEIWLDSPLRTKRDSEETWVTDWKVLPRHVWLPEDVSEVTAATIRRHPFNDTTVINQVIPVATDSYTRDLQLDLLDTADVPEALVVDPPEYVPAAGVFEVALESSVAANFALGTYEFAWCFVGPGQTMGPLSEPIAVTIKDPATQITFTFHHQDGGLMYSFTNQPDFSGTGQWPTMDEIPYPKALWMNRNYNHSTGERLGEPEWVNIPLGATVSDAQIIGGLVDRAWLNQGLWVFRDNNSVILFNGDYMQVTNECPCYRDVGGMVRPASIYPLISNGHYLDPVPDSDFNDRSERYVPPEEYVSIDLAYRKLPKPLTTDQTVPELPPEFHQVIVDRALMDICMMANDETKAQLYERRWLQGIKRLEKRYVAHAGSQYVRKPIGESDPWGGIWAATANAFRANGSFNGSR